MHLLFNQIKFNFIQIGISLLKIKRAYIYSVCVIIYILPIFLTTILKSSRCSMGFSTPCFEAIFILKFDLFLFTWTCVDIFMIIDEKIKDCVDLIFINQFNIVLAIA